MKISSDAPALPLWIGGRAFLTVTPGFYDLADASGQVRYRVPLGGADELAEAAASSARDLPGWAATAPAERGARLAALADQVATYSAHLAKLIAEDTGAAPEAAQAEVAAAVDALRAAAGTLETQAASQSPEVVAVLADSTRCFEGLVAKSAPVLAFGGVVILKPSPRGPSAAVALAELATRAGLPDGAVNLVHGDDALVAALAASGAVGRVLFAGEEALAVKLRQILGDRLVAG